MVTLLFALLAGIVTVAAPCTLPVLPVLFGASIGQTSNARPVFIALGFVASFTIVAIVFSAITQIVGIDPDRLRTVAFRLLPIFGFLMLWPRPFEWLRARAGDLLNRVHRIPIPAQSGNVGGFVLGTTLGLGLNFLRRTRARVDPHSDRTSSPHRMGSVAAHRLRRRCRRAYVGNCLWWPVRHHPCQELRPLFTSSSAGLRRGDHRFRGAMYLQYDSSSPRGFPNSIQTANQACERRCQ